jgi:hypothetical protein
MRFRASLRRSVSSVSPTPVQSLAAAAHNFPLLVAARVHARRVLCLVPDAQEEQNHDHAERHVEKPQENEFHGGLLRYLTPPDIATSRVR